MICPECHGKGNNINVPGTVNNLDEKWRLKNKNDKHSPTLVDRHVKCEPDRGGCGADWWYQKEFNNRPPVVKIDGKLYRDISEFSTVSTIKSSKRIHDKLFPRKGTIFNQAAKLDDVK